MSSLSHLPDPDLSHALTHAAVNHSTSVATLLAYIAEFDARRLYLPAGYASMREYCMRVLHFSEDAAFKRIRGARVARKFPVIFEAVAQGRLHLSAVIMLKPYLKRSTLRGLLAAATHKSKAEIAEMLAERFPQLDVPTSVQPNELAVPANSRLAPGPVVQHTPEELAPEPVGVTGTKPCAAPPVVAPLSTQRFALQVTIDHTTYQKLCRAQELLSHAVPHGDVAQVLDRALELLVTKLEKRKFGATEKPRTHTRRTSKNPRHIPAHVRRAVTERDGGQCTFISEDGHRCAARRLLEFDHVEEVARGGVATIENIRLRCRAHNQYSAECSFGVRFMERQRRKRKSARCSDEAMAPDHGDAQNEAMDRDLAAGLKTLGYRQSETREALAHCRTLNGASLEERMRAALALLRPRATTIRPPLDPMAMSLERVDDPARVVAAGVAQP